MKRESVLIVLAVLAVCGCQVEELQKDVPEVKLFTAVIEEGASEPTKTSLDATGRVLWKQGDQVSIFAGNSLNQQYQVSDESHGKMTASLNQLSAPGFVSSVDIDHNVAFYPYASSASLEKSGSSYVISGITLPALQYYAEGSFGNGAFPMVAVTSSTADMNLKFKNVLGGLKLQLKGAASIASISLTGKTGEILCGAAEVTVSNGNLPSVSLTDAAAKTVTLNCGAGVQLNTESATSFIIALPPMTMSGGFTVLVTDTQGGQMEIQTTKSQTIPRSNLLRMPEVTYEGTPEEPSAVDLGSSATANCYIVSEAGRYKFKTVKGNSSTSVGTISSVEVLWESYGTSTTPSKGSIIKTVSYSSNYITFETPSTLKNGNAVIAAKSAKGTIIWSWHIWVCSGYNPTSSAQTYYHGAGKMMDRNLGATSATPGSVGALGLFYQWGRKDPFLGSSSISSNEKAASTLNWPAAVTSDSNTGKITYAVSHPTTFIKRNPNNNDWHYSGGSDCNDTRWQSSKTIYDPCPPGWKVPYDAWWKAIGSQNLPNFEYPFDEKKKGMDLTGKFGSASTIWYPAAGRLDYNSGNLLSVGSVGQWWSTNTYSPEAAILQIHYLGLVHTNGDAYRAEGESVRCLKE